MALVFPVVHDFAGAGTSQWETLSSTALFGSPTEINPFHISGTLKNHNTPVGPVIHNGKLTLAYTVNNGSPYDEFTRVTRQLANGTWETLGAAEDLGFSSTSLSLCHGLVSYDGSLYCATEVGPKSGGSADVSLRRMRIYKYNESSNVWEEQTNSTNGLSNQNLNAGGTSGFFFNLGGILYYRWVERIWNTSQKLTLLARLVVAEHTNGSWSRISSENNVETGGTGREEDYWESWTTANGYLYSFRYDRIYRFGPATGLQSWSSPTSSTGITLVRSADWSDGQNFYFLPHFLRNLNGTPVVAFLGGRSGTGEEKIVPDKFFVSTIGNLSGSYTRTDINNPVSNLRFAGLQEANGEEYYLFQNISSTSANRGLVLYRKNGNNWSVVGGGLALQSHTVNVEWFRILGGSAYIFTTATNQAGTEVSYVIRRFPL